MINTNISHNKNSDPYKITLPKFDHSLFNGGKKIGSNPHGILLEIGLKEGNIIADFGCGVGFFVIEASKIVGTGGKVYAIDIDHAMLDSLKSRAMEGGIKNIYGILADLEEPNATKIENESCDVVIMTNFLYLIKKKDAVIAEAYRILKKGGKMVVMEWSQKGEHTMLEKEEHVPLKDLKDMARKLGMRYARTFEAGLAHEVQVFSKN